MRGPRWVLVGAILGSGAVFIEGTVTTVALPAIARDFELGISGLQWVMNGYLLTLSALILLGGALGDRFSRSRVFVLGLIGFAAASLACTVAPNVTFLVVARVLQGAAGALVVPNSLALLESHFSGAERGTAIGHWAGWSAVSMAFGPLVGGWLVDAISWRLVFACITPFAAAAAIVIGFGANARGAPDPTHASARVDYAGAALVTLGLAGVVGALIVGPDAGFSDTGVLVIGVAGLALLGAFVAVERHVPHPLLPLDAFRSREFSGVNAMTLFVYAALNGLFFLLMLQLQTVLGYSALAAGASLLPINVLMVLVSPLAGRVAERNGPRAPMVAGSLTAAAGMLLFMRVGPDAPFLTTVLPAAVVFASGLAWLVAPLTAVALGALGPARAGLASGVNNAVARLAGLLAVTGIPLAAGLGGMDALTPRALNDGFSRAMLVCAALCVAGSVVAAFTIPGAPCAREIPRERLHRAACGVAS
jgi:EmrB/QacA subfamily drug resistance transporter